MYYTTLEEIPLGEVVTIGTFLVNQHPIVVLFDSRASHSFMSQIFVSKHNQRVVTIDKGGYYISAARNNISTSQIVRDVRISISNREYTSDLVVLPGLGIDVILGIVDTIFCTCQNDQSGLIGRWKVTVYADSR